MFREVSSRKWTRLAAFEEARAAALERLGLTEAAVSRAARVPVFVFEEPKKFRHATRAPSWAAGCAWTRREGDEAEPVIYATDVGGDSVTEIVRHEAAHIFVAEAFPDLELPTWAVEGVACFAQGDGVRARMSDDLELCGSIAIQDLNRTRYDDLSSWGDAWVFYVESLATFEALVSRLGSIESALRAAADVRALGAPRGLMKAGVPLDQLEAALRREIAQRKRAP